LDRALVGFTDFALPGLMDTSREDDGPAGTTVNSGAWDGLASACEGLADFARLGFSFTAGKSGNNLWGVPLKGLNGSKLFARLFSVSLERDLASRFGVADCVLFGRSGVTGTGAGTGVFALDVDLSFFVFFSPCFISGLVTFAAGIGLAGRLVAGLFAATTASIAICRITALNSARIASACAFDAFALSAASIASFNASSCAFFHASPAAFSGALVAAA
jgi:hypothetical protein